MRDFLFYIFTKIKIDKEKIAKITLNSDFYDVLEKTKQAHKKHKKVANILSSIGIFLIILVVFGYFLIENKAFFAAISIMISLFVTYLLLGIYMSSYREYMEFYKENFITFIIKDIDKDFQYTYEKIRDFDHTFSDVGIWQYDGITKEDFITGKYNGILFEFAEFAFASKGCKQFGTILTCEFNKKFKHNLKIINKKLSFWSFFKKIRLKTENKDFNSIFDIKSDEEFEKYYLLSPSFMEKLVDINNSGKFGFISVVFKDGKIYVFGESGRDLFEAYTTFEPTLELAKYYKMMILEILSIIDELKLSSN